MESSKLVPAIVLTDLSATEQERISTIRNSVALTDSQSVTTYGLSAQSGIAEFSESILAEIVNKDAGFVGTALSSLLTTVKDLDVDSLQSGGALSKIPVIGKIFSAARSFIQRYEKLSVQIERITGELEKARMNILRDITMLDGLFQKNSLSLRELDLFIVAGQELLAELETVQIPAIEAKATESGDPRDAQALQDARQFASRFEKKLHDLKLSRMVSIQMNPQIRLIQNNNQLLVEKIQTSILTTIPLWKGQIVIAIALFRQKKAVDLQREVTDTTNELLMKNAEMLKDSSIQVARESERGIVDMETLRKVNGDLIATIEETLKIQSEGRQKRQIAEVELKKLESDLKQKLIGATNR